MAAPPAALVQRLCQHSCFLNTDLDGHFTFMNKHKGIFAIIQIFLTRENP